MVRAGGAELLRGLIVAKCVGNRQGSSDPREPGVQGTLGVSKPTRKRKEETLVEREQQSGSVCTAAVR